MPDEPPDPGINDPPTPDPPREPDPDTPIPEIPPPHRPRKSRQSHPSEKPRHPRKPRAPRAPKPPPGDPMPESPKAIDQIIREAMSGPKSVTVDGQNVTSHDLRQLIDADRYLASKNAKPGIRFSKMVASGAE